MSALMLATSANAITYTYSSTQTVNTPISQKIDVVLSIDPAAVVTFKSGTAASYGGALYAKPSLVINGGSVIFQGNRATVQGGAIFSEGNITINSNATFIDNQANYNGETNGVGGAISSQDGNITVTGNLVLTNNRSTNVDTSSVTSTYGGGAIYLGSGSLTVGGTLTASDNYATTSGGVLHMAGNVNHVFNGDVKFTNNSAAVGGGAIYSAVGSSTLQFKGKAEFEGNSSWLSGGAITASNAVFEDTVNFSNNIANGPIAASNTKGLGGGIYTTKTSTFKGLATFNANLAAGNGGGLNSAGDSVFENGALFTGNMSEGHGGAIFAGANLSISTGANATSFTGNSSVGNLGGAIYASKGNVTLVANGADIVFSGNTQNGTLSSAATTANSLYLRNDSKAAVLTLQADAGRRISFFDPAQNYAANGVLSVVKAGAGTVSFDGSRMTEDRERWSKLLANTQLQEGTFEIANGAVYGINGMDAYSPLTSSSFTTAAGTVLQGGVTGTVRADNFTHAGALNIAGARTDVRGVFTIQATNVTFEAGSSVLFNTYLNDGVVQNTDLLVLDLTNGYSSGSTTGQALIYVNNIGGLGAYTVGDGIRLVETRTGTSDNAFMLGAPVLAGAYEYFLYHGGNAETGGDVNDQHWYLRTEAEVTVEPPPTKIEPPTTPPEVVDPVPETKVKVPSYRPEVPLVSAIMPIGMQYGYSMLDTLHERVGDTFDPPYIPTVKQYYVTDKLGNRYLVKVQERKKEREEWFHGSWARLIGEHGSHDQGDKYSFIKSGPKYEYDILGVQAGMDLYGRVKQDGTLDKLGIYVGYGQVDGRVDGAWSGKAGSIDMDNYTIGGYWTHLDADGWYTDAVVQATWYETKARSIYGLKEDTDGFGIIASLEGGYKFDLGNNYTIEPQVQIAYQNLSFDKIYDGHGYFDMSGGDSLRGRIGARLTKEWNTEENDQKSPRKIKAWLRGNIWHEFMARTKTTVTDVNGLNPVSVRSPLNGTWGEIGVGVSGQVSDRMTLFATGAYNRSLDNKGYEAWDGRLGATYKW
ncbi:autotransporter outer membrane beta-barrel domain-containing protein [Microvirga sp. W0021]|uniref:Autotransporter outer membrane beta-barrel domain-containing protein n=1 Tax=Hohaiivirga grylli TaxID=3133970 RepID=A0ABV0BJU4_9HYPH